jgi:hypothetical protein
MVSGLCRKLKDCTDCNKKLYPKIGQLQGAITTTDEICTPADIQKKKTQSKSNSMFLSLIRDVNISLKLIAFGVYLCD